jgi:hypothetical protein
MFNLFKKSSTGIGKILEIKNDNEKIVALHSFCNQHYKNWTETEKLINAVLDMESEVMNGGFHQYFQNSAGDQWQEALTGLGKIGAAKAAELLTKALTVFAESRPPVVREERQKIANELSQERVSFLDSLDQDFYKYEDKILSLVITYAERNRSDFGNS